MRSPDLERAHRPPPRAFRPATARSSPRVAWLVPLLWLLGCGSSHGGAASANPNPTDPNPTDPGPTDPGPTDLCPRGKGEFWTFQPVPAEPAPAAVRAAGEAGLPWFLNSLGDDWARFGFQSKEELGVAELGEPHAVYTFSSLSHSEASDVATPRNWLFPVVANGAFRCMLTVAFHEGRWQAVVLGDAGFAQWLQSVETSHPPSGSTALVEVGGFSCHPFEFLGVDLEKATPSFVPVPPWTTELVRRLPEYGGWTASDPVPVLSWEQLTAILRTLAR